MTPFSSDSNAHVKISTMDGENFKDILIDKFDPGVNELKLKSKGSIDIKQIICIAFLKKSSQTSVSSPKGGRDVHAIDQLQRIIDLKVQSLRLHKQGFFAWPNKSHSQITHYFYYFHGIRRLENPARIGEIIVSEGLAPQEAIDKGLSIQHSEETSLQPQSDKNRSKLKHSPQKHLLGEILVESGSLEEATLVKALSAKYHLPVVNISEEDISLEAISSVQETLIRKYKWLPIRVDAYSLVIAVNDPANNSAYDDFRFSSNKKIQLVLARLSQIEHAIAELLPEWTEVSEEAIEFEAPTADAKSLSVDELELTKTATTPPVVRLVNRIIKQGLASRASDIHISPQENEVVLSYRIDGDLRRETTFSNNLLPKVISRIKILADMDISEHRLTQDGRIRIKSDGKSYELRISIIPNNYGETVVMRILDHEKAVELKSMGFSEDDQSTLMRLVRKPRGMILVTGATGSGKSTSLFALVRAIANDPIHILTIEDPVEQTTPGINQIPVNASIGMTFARVLRNALRHDPDVILVGEIRDHETAEISMRAALTGHLLLSTLHTISAANTITRLQDMGIPPYMLAQGLLAIVSQDLVKRQCPSCRVPIQPSETLDKLLRESGYEVPRVVYKNEGCDDCSQTGIAGRLLLYELMVMNERVRQAVHDGISGAELTKIAEEEGMVPKNRLLLKLLSQGDISEKNAMSYLD